MQQKLIPMVDPVLSLWEKLERMAELNLPHIVVGFAVFVCFLGIGILFKIIIAWGSRRDPRKHMVINLLGKTVRLLFIIVGAIITLDIWGINVSALVASLGLGAFAIGFALKDAIANVLAGIIIIFHRTYRLNDMVTVGGVTGKVSNIDLRYTTLVSDTHRIMVPNAMLLDTVSMIERKSS